MADSQKDQKGGGCDPDLMEGRDQADQRGGAAHEDDRCDEDDLAAVSVANSTEHDGTDGAGEESDGVGRESREQGDSRIRAGDEDVAEDESRCEAVEREVDVFHRCAEPDREGGAHEICSGEGSFCPFRRAGVRMPGGWEAFEGRARGLVRRRRMVVHGVGSFGRAGLGNGIEFYGKEGSARPLDSAEIVVNMLRRQSLETGTFR